MAKEAKQARCCGCGKTVDEGQPHVNITRVGKEPKRGERPEKVWGQMHNACFGRMTGKPQDLLEVLSTREAAQSPA